MALIIPMGRVIRGAVLPAAYVKIDSLSIANGRATAVVSVYASQAGRNSAVPPLDVIVLMFPLASLPRSVGVNASVLTDFYQLVKAHPLFAGSADDLVAVE